LIFSSSVVKVLSFRQRTGVGHAHSGVSNVTQDTAMERPHRVRMPRGRFKLDDSLTGLDGSERKAKQRCHRGRRDLASPYLLYQV
jgi:hypothetical protein